MFSRLFIQFVGIDWLTVFDDNVGFFHPWELFLKDGDGIVHGNGDDGTSGLLCDF